MLKLSNVTKYYPTQSGDRLVLDNITFKLERGQRLGILGCNGAGKSTLIRIISGIELPSSGDLHFGMSISWPLALQGGFVGGLSGLDNLRFICRVYDIDYRKALPSIEEFSGLGRYLREPIRRYSSGMRARLAFAISMAVNFDCYLIDEVTAVGDKAFQDKCQYALLEEKKNCSLILVSHVSEVIKQYCTIYSVLDRGKLFVYDSYDAATQYYNEVMSQRTQFM